MFSRGARSIFGCEWGGFFCCHLKKKDTLVFAATPFDSVGSAGLLPSFSFT